MSEKVRRIVDELAEVLQRSVAVDDVDVQPVAVSPHHGAIDDARLEAILARRTSAEIVKYVKAMGLERATGPVRLPADPAMGVLPRLVIPLRQFERHLGYFWLIDAEPPIDAVQEGLARAAAAEVEQIMAAEALAADDERAADAAMVEELLSTDPARAEGALEQLRSAGRLRPGTSPGVAVARLAGRSRGSAAHSDVAGALSSTPLRSVLGHTVAAAIDDRIVVVADDLTDSATGWAAGSVFERMRAALATRNLALVAIGVSANPGCPVSELHRRARYAADVAVAVPSLPRVTDWNELGPWQLFAGVEWTWDSVERMYPGISVLLQPRHRELAVTLATFLDTGGDTGATVCALRIHRTSFYYRRDRILDLIGDGWVSGWGRLGAHAAMVLAAQLEPSLAPLPRATGDPHGA